MQAAGMKRGRLLSPASFCMNMLMNNLFALSSLELGLFSELFMFMLAHFLLTPLLYISHTNTSSSIV